MGTCLVLMLTGCFSPMREASGWKVARESAPVAPTIARAMGFHYGPVVAHRIRQWQALMENAASHSEADNLRRVNDFFNGARFVDDAVSWGENDYWATPLEFLVRDAGDCEDFATAKYFTLQKMGVAPAKLRLVYSTFRDTGQAHMVLAYYPDQSGDPLVLDNINRRIRPGSERSDLVPIFSFNGDSLWLARRDSRPLRAGSPGSLQRWSHWQKRSRQQFLASGES
jgi:predicted transglutaminase-like cysteine proteinase